MIYFILILSFLLEGSFSNLVYKNSLFIPLFFITSLSIIYPYFNNKKLNFIIVCLICGMFYDIIFTNSTFINTLSFPICGCLIILGYNYMNYNIFSSNFINTIVLILYRVISYLLLCLVSFTSFNIIELYESIYSSIIANVIYGILIYGLIYILNKIFKIKRVEK